MKTSFAPLLPDAVQCLTDMTGVDFSYGSMQEPKWFCCTVRDDRGELMFVLACEFRTWFDASFNAVVLKRRALSKRLYRAVFTALFSRARRVTAEIDVDNRAALKIVPRMGFVYEGYCRLGINGVKDAYVFGMVKEDCVFLPDYVGGTITKVLEIPDGQRRGTH